MSDLAEPASPSLARRRWIIVVIFVLALVPRLGLVGQTVAQHPEGSFTEIAGDSGQYMALGLNLLQYGHFADDRPQGRREGQSYFSLLRPPGYPLYCAAFQAMEWPAGILWGQAICGALTAAGVAWLAGAICRSDVAAIVAGVGSSLSPTGIGLAGLVLADLPFAALFVAGLVALWLAANVVPRMNILIRAEDEPDGKGTDENIHPWHRISLWYVAGAIFGVSILVKPVGLYWPLVMPLVGFLWVKAAGSSVRWRHLLGGSALSIAMVLSWAAHNRVVHGLFAVSTVDAQNLRFYLAPVVEEWAKAGRQPSSDAVRKNRTAVMSRDDVDRRKTPAATLVRRQWTGGLAIVRSHPRETWNAYWDNVDRQLAADFGHFDLEMPRGGIVRDLLVRLEKATDSNGAYWIVVTLMTVPLVLPWIVPRARREASWPGRALAAPALWVTFVYLAIFVGTTTGTGSRILYPAEAPALLLIACGVTSIARDGTRLGKA